MNTNGMNTIKVMTDSDIPLIRKLFKSDIENYLEISHFSVILVTPTKEAYIVSASKKFSDKYKEHGFHQYDNTMSHLMYENLDFYTWAEGYVKVHQDEIASIKKSYGLNNGTVFVRRLGEYTLLYCIATKKEDPIMKTIFINNANSILQLGDYAFNELKQAFENSVENLILPKIEIFEPFLYREIPCLTSYEQVRRSKILKVIEDSKSLSAKPNLKIIHAFKK